MKITILPDKFVSDALSETWCIAKTYSKIFNKNIPYSVLKYSKTEPLNIIVECRSNMDKVQIIRGHINEIINGSINGIDYLEARLITLMEYEKKKNYSELALLKLSTNIRNLIETTQAWAEPWRSRIDMMPFMEQLNKRAGTYIDNTYEILIILSCNIPKYVQPLVDSALKDKKEIYIINDRQAYKLNRMATLGFEAFEIESELSDLCRIKHIELSDIIENRHIERIY